MLPDGAGTLHRDKVEAAYLRADLVEKRRHVMQAWDNYSRECRAARSSPRLQRDGKQPAQRDGWRPYRWTTER